MKKSLLIVVLLNAFVVLAQGNEKEEVFILFDLTSDKKCLIEDGSGNFNYEKFFRKKRETKRIIFHVCDQEFGFEINQPIDTLNSIKNLNIKGIDYIKRKYQEGNDFKHHVFKKIYILEKLSNDRILKYDVTWCCEWSID